MGSSRAVAYLLDGKTSWAASHIKPEYCRRLAQVCCFGWFVTWVLTALPFSKRRIEPQTNTKKQIIEISSDEESVSENEVMRESNKSIASTRKSIHPNSVIGSLSKRLGITLDTAIDIPDSDDECPTATKAVPTKAAIAFSQDTTTYKLESMALKKRTLSNSVTSSPRKRRITLNTAIDILDSDDESPTAMETAPMKAATAFSNMIIGPVKVESSGAEKMTSSNEAARDKDGRYRVTQKVKVDLIEKLWEVPACWPIPSEETTTAYVIDLNNDKKWQELLNEMHQALSPSVS